VIAASAAVPARPRARPPPETTSKSASPCQRAAPRRLSSTRRAVSLSAARPSFFLCASASRAAAFEPKQKPHRALSSVGSLFEDLLRADLHHARNSQARSGAKGPIQALIAWPLIGDLSAHPERHVRDQR